VPSFALVRSDLLSPRRRRAGLLVAVAATAGLLLAACSDNIPDTPAISGENPADVTVPSLPTTTVPTATTASGGDQSQTPSEGDSGAVPAGEGVTTTTAAP